MPAETIERSEKPQAEYRVWTLFIVALTLTTPWMLLPLSYGLITKRWSWWGRWLTETVGIDYTDSTKQ